MIPGQSNENEIIIKEGLEKGKMVHLIPPLNKETYTMDLLDTAIVKKYKREAALKKSSPEATPDSTMFNNMTPEQIQKMMKSGGGKRKGGRRSNQ